MPSLEALAHEVTGRRVSYAYDDCWFQDDGVIFVPEFDDDGLLHEILHWAVASDDERTWPNLALDEYDVTVNAGLPEDERLAQIDAARRERQACFLARRTYALREMRVPPWSPCADHPTVAPEEAEEATARLAQLGGDALLQRLADALTLDLEDPTLPRQYGRRA